jgi:hypothetical protein
MLNPVFFFGSETVQAMLPTFTEGQKQCDLCGRGHMVLWNIGNK